MHRMTAETIPPAEVASGTSPRRGLSVRRGLAGGVLVVLLAGLTHPWTLPYAAHMLIADDGHDSFEMAFLLGGPDCLDWAQEALASGRIQRIGLSRDLPSRFVERGILPDSWTVAQVELDARQIPEELRWTMPGEQDGWEGFAVGLSLYLQEYPGSHVALVTSCYRSRWLQGRMGRLVTPDLISRVHVVAVDHTSVQPGDWWKTREGQQAVITEWVRLTCSALATAEARKIRRTPEEFQRAAVAP